VIQTLSELFTEAANRKGSQAALARHLGVGPQQVHKWKTASRPIPASVLASLCDVCQLTGEEARRVLADAECLNPKHATIREVLRRAFFGVVALGAVLGGLNSTNSHAQSTGDNLYIVRSIRRALRLLGRAGLLALAPALCGL